MPSKKSARFTGNRTAAIGLIVVCIIGTAILIAARTSESTSAASVAAQTAVQANAAIPEAPKTPRADAIPAAAPKAGQTAAQAEHPAEPATITGCLDQDNDTFRLKNTSGEDAPKGRSWKSGFLKKGSKAIEVVDARHRLNLASHVGQRVTVSGMLDDKELAGSSIKRLAESCN